MDAEALRPGDVLTLEDSLRLALRQSPDLVKSRLELRAADARTLQAGLFPNPEIGVEIEEFGGGRELAGFGGSEATLAVAQPLPLGGRIGDGRRVAALARDTAGWEHEATRLDVYARTARAFTAVLAAQDRLKLGEEAVRLGEGMHRSAAEQVAAGKSAPLEESKARVELSLLRLRRERLAQELDSRRRRLAATWGSSETVFGRVEGRLDRLRPVPGAERVMGLVGENPEVARTEAEVAQAGAAVDLARSEAIPDLVVAGGIKRFEETEEYVFVAGLAIDLPLFDRNQGGIAEARAELRKTTVERGATMARVRLELIDARRALVVATDQVHALQTEVVPTARATYDAFQVGFREGKNDFLEVLDAQRTLLEASGELVDALEAHHDAAVEVERLVGRSLDRPGVGRQGRPHEESPRTHGPSEPASARKESHDGR